MEEKKTSSKKLIIALVAFVAVIAVFVACWYAFGPSAKVRQKNANKETPVASSSQESTAASSEAASSSSEETVPAGSVKVTIEVKNKAGETTSYNVVTDGDYLKQAMEAAEGLTFSGTDSGYGLFVDTINGETADYNVDASYWAIYVNGEYGNYGIDQQPLADGDVYLFEYTVYTSEEGSEEVPEGSVKVTIEVVNKAGETTTYDVVTDGDYLKQAMEAAEGLTFSGTDSGYGLFVDTINGETADYNVDASYWAIYVNGEYGNYGIDQQPLADNDVYRFEYTVYTAN